MCVSSSSNPAANALPAASEPTQSRKILDRMLAGEASAGEPGRLAALARLLQDASLCGLGMSVSKPVQSALQHFSDYFSADCNKARESDR